LRLVRREPSSDLSMAAAHRWREKRPSGAACFFAEGRQLPAAFDGACGVLFEIEKRRQAA
jgi:hypothetical protein